MKVKIKKFWIVTKPNTVSTLADICFPCDIHSLQLQFLGGLDSFGTHGIYTTEKEAKEIAEWLLHKREVE